LLSSKPVKAYGEFVLLIGMKEISTE